MVFTINIKTGDFLDPDYSSKSCDPENVVSPYLGLSFLINT